LLKGYLSLCISATRPKQISELLMKQALTDAGWVGCSAGRLCPDLARVSSIGKFVASGLGEA